MTFVAQPYEYFADDLLTALTGGMIREEHQFIGIEEQYSLASPGAIPQSVKVVGQRNDAIALFQGGIDYVYSDGVIAWQEKGRPPDDHTFFYVNYYPQEGRRKLTDRNPGSVTTTLAEAFAREFAVLHKQMEMIYKSAFVDLADGPSLDHVAALLAVERKDAKFAVGEVMFKRTTPADGDITIPAGTLVSSDNGQNFETTDKRTLRKGQLSVVVPIRAQMQGPGGRVETGAIKNINRPIFGVETVLNEAATFFATAKETDEELRRRIKGTLERAGKSTVNSIKFSLIEGIPGINEGNVQVSENSQVPGKVEVKFGLGGTVDPDLVRRIEETIFYSRPAGVRVTHNLPTRSADVAATGTQVAEVFNRRSKAVVPRHLDQSILAQMPEGILDLEIDIQIQLAEANLSASQKETIEDEVRSAALAYIESLPMGADVIYSKLLGQVASAEKVRDAALVIRPVTAGHDSRDNEVKQNLATDGRKPTVERGNIFVSLMEESIIIQVSVRLKAASGGSEGDAPKVTSALRSAITDVVKRTLDGAGNTLTREALKTAIGKVVESTDKRLIFAESNDVVVNAEYEETGRLLYDTDQVAIAENQVLALGRVDVTIPGELDG